MTDQARLAAIRQRADAATPGPWKWPIPHWIGSVSIPTQKFIENCREDVPWLLDQITSLQTEVERLRMEVAALKAAAIPEADLRLVEKPAHEAFDERR